MTNYTTLIQKYRAQRNPPRGSTAQIPMPTGATTGASFPLPPTPPTTNAPPVTGYAPPPPQPVIVAGVLAQGWRGVAAALPWGIVAFTFVIMSALALVVVAIIDGDIRLFQSSTAIAQAPVIQERIVERVVTATAQPTSQPTEPPAPVVMATAPPPVYAPPARPQPVQPVQRQAVRNLPAPPVQAQAPPSAAWPAPARQTTRAVYVCPDGAQFPQDDSRWAWGLFGQWHMEGSGDVVDIRDSLENNAAMGWHYKCRREWR